MDIRKGPVSVASRLDIPRRRRFFCARSLLDNAAALMSGIHARFL
jgi:hypothetical protein